MRYATEKDRLDYLKADATDRPVRDHLPSLGSKTISTPSNGRL
jgi:hypothetical protein